ncbi:MAG TPA: ATP-binding protein, partial [Kribbellaceae bacterium]|nr:ATP-binding protein [Kribbellaceae bacterium]
LTVDAETGTRGFLATGRREFLEPYDRAVSDLPGVRDALAQLMEDDERQDDQLPRLDSALATELRTLRSLQRSGPASPRRTEALVASKTTMDALRSVLSEIAEEEQVQESEKAEAAARLRGLVTAITVAAGGLGLIGGLLSMTAVSSGLTRRVQLVQDNARRLAEAKPLLPMPADEDELGELGTTMSRTAELIADKQAMLDIALTTGGLILFELHPDGYVRFRGDRHLLSELGLRDDRPVDLEPLRARLGLEDQAAGRQARVDETGASRVDLAVPTVSGDELRLEVRWREVTANNRRPTGMVVGVASDVSDRLRAQRAFEIARDAAERASRAKDEFLSRMSHELRTPLNAVLGFAQLLEMDGLDEEQRDSVEHILRGGRHLLALVNEVLDLTRVESGSFALSLEPIRLWEVVDDAVHLMKPIADDTGVTVDVLPCDTDVYVEADHQRLKQVLINLVSNGIKYNRRGGSVTVGWHRYGSGRVAIEVADTGAGIAPHRLPDLFTPFERLGAEQTTVEGTGLGLALSHRLTQAMSGGLTLASTGPEGSTFVAELPEAEGVVAHPPPAPAGEDVTVAEPPPDLSDVTVLYVEDNLANLSLVEELLRRADAPPPLSAVQGSLGLELAQVHSPDLILLDRHLPDMRGEDVLAQLRADPRTADIPVVVISADVMPGRGTALRDAGATAFLTKPIDVEAFWGAISTAVRERRESL